MTRMESWTEKMGTGTVFRGRPGASGIRRVARLWQTARKIEWSEKELGGGHC